MKALSIKEPWASLIRTGQKTIETRVWRTHYRGIVLLCASKKPESLISGQAFAIARITDCRVMTEEDEPAAGCEVYENAWSWQLSDIVRLEKPFAIKGSLGLFNLSVTCQKCERVVTETPHVVSQNGIEAFLICGACYHFYLWSFRYPEAPRG